jgi:hypothetical protein
LRFLSPVKVNSDDVFFKFNLLSLEGCQVLLEADRYQGIRDFLCVMRENARKFWRHRAFSVKAVDLLNGPEAALSG